MTGDGGVHIRVLASYDELQRCVRFQKSIWGDEFSELVPAAILMVAGRTGGLVAGAFDPEGGMVGFVFGLTGFRDGVPLHWSDMLAVAPGQRGRGIGQRLKQFQRAWLLERGVTLVRWTFDPLEARNAFINFRRLGVTAREYVRDCYGASDSPLHAGLATDRLVVDWQLDAPHPAATAPIPYGAVWINPPGRSPGAELDLDPSRPLLRLRVPSDIQQLKKHDIAAARAWRTATRSAFETCLAHGYVVTDFSREGDSCGYLLQRTPG